MMVDQAEWFRLGINGVVPVRWVASKAGSDPGSLVGYASVWNVVDQQLDIVIRGAFRKTLQEWRASKRVIPLTVDHDHSANGIIGSLTSAVEDTSGLKIAATFSGTPRAQEARQKAIEGHLAGLSIFGQIFKKSFQTRDDGVEIRILEELGLAEVAMTGFPANLEATVSAVKSGIAAAAVLPDAWVADMRSALTISSATVRKMAVDELVRAQYPLASAATPSTETEPATGTETEPATGDDASEYALRIADGLPDPPAANSVEDLLAAASSADMSVELDELETALRSQG